MRHPAAPMASGSSVMAAAAAPAPLVRRCGTRGALGAAALLHAAAAPRPLGSLVNEWRDGTSSAIGVMRVRVQQRRPRATAAAELGAAATQGIVHSLLQQPSPLPPSLDQRQQRQQQQEVAQQRQRPGAIVPLDVADGADRGRLLMRSLLHDVHSWQQLEQLTLACAADFSARHCAAALHRLTTLQREEVAGEAQ